MGLPLVAEQVVHFWGHVLPGTYLLLLGLYGFHRVCYRYHDAKRLGRPFYATLTIPSRTRFGYVQVEGCFKLVAVIQVLLEILSALRPSHGKMATETNTQHSTMCLAYVCSGIVDILVHLRTPLPPKADYAAYMMALFTEGILFAYHLDGRDEVNMAFHTLLVYTIALTCVVLVGEIVRPDIYIFPFIRTALMILQATWFFQISISLYTTVEYPYSKPIVPSLTNEHGPIMWVIIYFCWHVNAIFMVCLTIFGVMSRFFTRQSSKNDTHGYEMLSAPILQTTEVDLDSE